jgi:hypothetical protein
MPSKPLSAGDIVEARCTRCRLITNHTIIAMVGGTPARVQCNTCDGVHKYRDPRPAETAKKVTPAKKATPGTPRAPRKSPLDAERAEWQNLAPTLDPSRAIPYGMNQSYRVGNIMEHPLFGLGVVTAATGPNKVEVLFREGKKLLRCGR